LVDYDYQIAKATKAAMKIKQTYEKAKSRPDKKHGNKNFDRMSTHGQSDSGSYAPNLTLTSLVSSQEPEKKRKKLDKPVKGAPSGIGGSNFSILKPI